MRCMSYYVLLLKLKALTMDSQQVIPIYKKTMVAIVYPNLNLSYTLDSVGLYMI